MNKKLTFDEIGGMRVELSRKIENKIAMLLSEGKSCMANLMEELLGDIKGLESKYEILVQTQHGRNWDDDEAERKLVRLAEEYKVLEAQNHSLRKTLDVANENDDYYTYVPNENNHLSSLASDKIVKIRASDLVDLLREAIKLGERMGRNEHSREMGNATMDDTFCR